MTVEKKVWPEFFEKIMSGEKTFELRLADFDCEPGDALLLREWDPATKQYTGRQVMRKIVYVLKTKDVQFWPKEDIERYGLQIIAFEKGE